MEPARRGVRSDVVTGGRLALRALQLLRRHPGLLWLPVLIAVFNVAERNVGQYAMLTRTDYGRQKVAELRRVEQQAKGPSSRGVKVVRVTRIVPGTVRYSLRQACGLLSVPSTTPEAAGAAQFIYFRALEVPFGSRWPTPLICVFLPMALLSCAVGALLAAGYYAAIRGVIEADEVQWGRFWPGVRRYAPHLLLYYILFMIVTAPAFVLPILSSRGGVLRGWAAEAHLFAYLWVDPLLMLSLALTPVAVVMADLPFLRAVGRSVVTIWGRVSTTAVLLLGTVVVCVTVSLPYRAASEAVQASRYGHASTESLIALPLDAVYEAAIAVVATWAVLALFLWYREAYPVPVVASEEAPPAAA